MGIPHMEITLRSAIVIERKLWIMSDIQSHYLWGVRCNSRKMSYDVRRQNKLRVRKPWWGKLQRKQWEPEVIKRFWGQLGVKSRQKCPSCCWLVFANMWHSAWEKMTHSFFVCLAWVIPGKQLHTLMEDPMGFPEVHLRQWTSKCFPQNVFSGPAASAPSGNFLEMQICRTTPNPQGVWWGRELAAG